MKVTYNWLNDFVNINESAEKLASMLTMAGLEVISLEKRDGDYVFEIEVTPNRPDCLSVIGIAREVAAIIGRELKLGSRFSALRLRSVPMVSAVEPSVLGSRKNRKAKSASRNLTIRIEDKKDCPLYIARIIKDVKVTSSPAWLKKRLEFLGLRSVNNIVDITNYVLLEYGEPLHAFDLDRLNGSTIIVRRAKNNERIITIDAESRNLNSDTLVIADKEKPLAIAGIMGGKDTEVTEGTKNILLEAAIFDPITVRRTRQKLGLQSESSYRFERGIEAQIVEKASLRATELIGKLAKGKCVLAKSSGTVDLKEKYINLDVYAVNKILGADISSADIKKILNNLGLKAKPRAKNNLSVRIPSYRQDINLEIDLIEEIARIYGYENIPKSQPAIKPHFSESDVADLVALIKNTLVGLGLSEVITYSLVDKNSLEIFGSIEAPIEILNPLSKEQDILRTQLMPSICRCIAYNLNQKQDDIRIFEIAHIYLGSHTSLREKLALGIALSGAKPLLLKQGMVKDEMSLLHLKGILEALFDKLGIKNYDFHMQEDSSVVNVYANRENLGFMMRLTRKTLDKLEIKNKNVFALEIDLDRLICVARPKQKPFKPLPKYPPISRDISFILKEEISIKDVLAKIKEQAGPLLYGIKIIDFYKGKQIPAGYKSLTVSCEYRSDERTLTETEINPIHTLIGSLLSEQFAVHLR